jgi:hypothetical protein
MAKNVPFIAVFLVLIAFSPSNLFSTPTHFRASMPVETCQAPAPDSFRVASAGGNFISLSWKPVWPGAAYFLTASEKNSSGGWVPIQIFPDVQDTSFTVDGLEGGKSYRFHISTKCTNGDVSDLIAWVDGISLIVDLTLLGRTPKNPVPISGSNIPYQSYEWIGFKVSGAGASSLFEVEVNEDGDEPLAFIRRVNLGDKIVAVDGNDFYPIPMLPLIEDVAIPFQINQVLPENHISIGNINLIEYFMPPSIDLEIFGPWKPNYEFQVLKADAVILVPPGNGSSQGMQIDPIGSTLQPRFNNPFSNQLDIDFGSELRSVSQVTISLFDSNCKKVACKQMGSATTQCSMQTNDFSKGLFYLVIESDSGVNVFKVIKSN